MADIDQQIQLTYKTDKASYSVAWDDKNNIVEVLIVGEIDGPFARKLVQAYVSVLREHPESGNILIDTTNSKELTTEARHVFGEVKNYPEVKKLAFFGASVYVRVMINFISALSRQTQTKFVSSKEEALDWFKSK